METLTTTDNGSKSPSTVDDHVHIGDGYVIQENIILGTNPADGQLTIGKNALIRSDSIIYSNVKIGNNFRTGHRILVRGNTEIGDNVLIGTDSVVDGNCIIGNNVSIQTNVYVTTYTTIEDNVFMGPCSVTTNDKYMAYGNKLVGCTIKKGARIGANATILPGVVIGEGAIVGSGAVVTKDVPAGITVVGNPARPVNRSRKNIRVAVIGMGYVGIPAAALLAEAGYKVTGIQRRSERSGWKIDCLNKGECPIGGHEPELPDMLKKAVANGKFKVTDDYSALKDVDIVLIDVQTATGIDHVPRYESLKEACHSLGKMLRPGSMVIIESTVGPGTTEYVVKPILEAESGLKAGLPGGFGLSFSYERVMVGRLVHNIREYPKIVGGIDAESTRLAMDLYKSIVKGGVYGTDIISAEIAKTVENAYRDVQIAFANEVALLCESLGADVYDIRKYVNGLPDDPSVPHANPIRNMHFPGAGVGGHCLPKDTWLLINSYREYSEKTNPYPTSVLADARHLNDWMPIHMVDLIESGLKEAGGELKGSRIGVLGYAFLENSDDARNSPSATLLKELEKRGATFRIHDPFVTKDSGYEISQDLSGTLKGCDAVAIMTKHNEYAFLEPGKLKQLLRRNVIVDGRNILDPAMFMDDGFVYRGVGKGKAMKKIDRKV